MKKKTIYLTDENMYKCECGKLFEKSQSLNSHFSHCIIHRNGIPEKRAHVKDKTMAGWNNFSIEKKSSIAIKAADTRKKLGFKGTFFNKTHTEDSKRKISEKRIAYLENSPHIKWFIVNNGIRDIKVQGKWELTIANWLNSNNIKWDRIRIKYDGHRTYTPDFWLPEFNFFIEVKGWLRNEDIIKMNKVVMENSIDLRILNKELYNKLDTITFDDLIKWQI